MNNNDDNEDKFERPFSKGLKEDEAARIAAGPDLMNRQNTTYKDIYDGPSEDLKDPIISEKIILLKKKDSLEKEIRSLEEELKIKKKSVESCKKKINEITEIEKKAVSEMESRKLPSKSFFSISRRVPRLGGKTRKNKRKTGKNNRKSRRY
jgi:vacuolar-type H+-ATPase subunit I/STV1